MNSMRVLLIFGFLILCNLIGLAQPQRRGPGQETRQIPTTDQFLSRLLIYDSNGDGSLSIDELSDRRLLPLFKRADRDENHIVTKEEWTALYEKEAATLRGELESFPDFGPPGPFAGPPRPGQIFPPFLVEALDLSNDQIARLDELQKDVNQRLEKILTEAQKKQLNERLTRGPGAARPRRGQVPQNPNGNDSQQSGTPPDFSRRPPQP